MIGIAGTDQGLMTLAVGGYLAVENEIAELLNVRDPIQLPEEQQIAKEIIRKHLSHLVQHSNQAPDASQ